MHPRRRRRGSRAELISSPTIVGAALRGAMAASTSSKPELRVRRRILAGHHARHSAARARGAAPRRAAAASHAVFARSLLQVSETWDTCIENTIRKLAYGALGGVVLSVVLFRAPPPAPRAAAAATAAALLPPRAAASPAGVRASLQARRSRAPRWSGSEQAWASAWATRTASTSLTRSTERRRRRKSSVARLADICAPVVFCMALLTYTLTHTVYTCANFRAALRGSRRRRTAGAPCRVSPRCGCAGPSPGAPRSASSCTAAPPSARSGR